MPLQFFVAAVYYCIEIRNPPSLLLIALHQISPNGANWFKTCNFTIHVDTYYQSSIQETIFTLCSWTSPVMLAMSILVCQIKFISFFAWISLENTGLADVNKISQNIRSIVLSLQLSMKRSSTNIISLPFKLTIHKI